MSQTNIQAVERELVQDGTKPKPNELITRWIGAPGNQIKVDWMKNTLSGYGLTATEQPFTADGFAQNNAVGQILGKDPNAIYMVSGHIDSDSATHATWAQAADDDASGIAVAMEAARVLKAFQPCLKSTLNFAGLNDEEFTAKGGPVYIQSVAGKTFKGEFDLDQVGFKAGEADCIDNTYNGAPGKALADHLATVNTKYGIGLNMPEPLGDVNYGTDAASFWAANLPALYHEECDKNMPNETTDDNMAAINYSQMTKDAKIIVAGMAELASQ